MELAANDRLIVKNILVQQVGFLGDASERAKDNTELLTLTAEMLDALKMIALKSLRSPLIRGKGSLWKQNACSNVRLRRGVSKAYFKSPTSMP